MEHAHSVQDWLWPKRRRKHLTLQAEINEITIACTAPDPEQDKITCSLAREIWKSTYGRPRASQRSARADKGTVRTNKAKSLNKFLDGCRRALKEKVKDQGYRNMEAVAMSAARGVEEVWNGKMAEEMKFLANKKSEALSSCITSGVLCAGDYSPVASQAAEKRKAHAMELKAEREREAKKRRDFMSFRPIALSAGDKVFFATTVPISVRNQVLARRRVHLERCMKCKLVCRGQNWGSGPMQSWVGCFPFGRFLGGLRIPAGSCGCRQTETEGSVRCIQPCVDYSKASMVLCWL